MDNWRIINADAVDGPQRSGSLLLDKDVPSHLILFVVFWLRQHGHAPLRHGGAWISPLIYEAQARCLPDQPSAEDIYGSPLNILQPGDQLQPTNVKEDHSQLMVWLYKEIHRNMISIAQVLLERLGVRRPSQNKPAETSYRLLAWHNRFSLCRSFRRYLSHQPYMHNQLRYSSQTPIGVV